MHKIKKYDLVILYHVCLIALAVTIIAGRLS